MKPIQCLIIILLCLLYYPLSAQIKLTGHHAVTATSYLNADGYRDSIYICNLQQGNERVILSYLGESSNDTYKLYKRSTPSDRQLLTSSNGTDFHFDLTESGCYEIEYTLNAAPAQLTCLWVFYNQGFDFSMLVNQNGEVLYNYKQCAYTDFLMDNQPNLPTFQYFSPITAENYQLDNTLTYTAEGNGSSRAIRLNTQEDIAYFRLYDPPANDATYTFKATDKFGYTATAKAKYITIISEANITATLPEIKPQSAPVNVQFSARETATAREYLFRFGDGDSAFYDLENTLPSTVEHTYYIPGTYTIELLVNSLWGCESKTTTTVTVSPSVLQVGNVFTPNGDGLNDYFIPDNTSIKRFEINIYTKAGRRVYRYKGEDLRNWQGWDGKIQDTDRQASVGIYLYELYAIDYDQPTQTYKQAGFIYLYR